jgi:hypothetical protein
MSGLHPEESAAPRPKAGSAATATTRRLHGSGSVRVQRRERAWGVIHEYRLVA